MVSLKGQGHEIRIGYKWYHCIDLYQLGSQTTLTKILKCCFIFFINILKSFVVVANFMPIANMNKIVFAN